MHFIPLLILTLALPVVIYGVPATTVPRCQLDKGDIVGLPSTFTPPTTQLKYVSVAAGYQNYTCDSKTSTYTNVGAQAELYDISCLYTTPAFKQTFDTLQDNVWDDWRKAPTEAQPTKDMIRSYFVWTPVSLGHHYFVTNPVTKQGLSPKWDLATSLQISSERQEAYIVAAKEVTASAPSGPQDIDWVQLKGVTSYGALASHVYRTDTRNGQPPASCTPGSPDIKVKYASKYWLFA